MTDAAGIRWRWEEKDFGFRFRTKEGRAAHDHYQAARPGEFYLVPGKHSKLDKADLERLIESAGVPTDRAIVPTPWKDYDREWDWIVTGDGVLLNFAGCLDPEVIHRREDEGVGRATQYVASLLDRPSPAPLAIDLIRNVHRELMGQIYPFAGEWRTVALHKGDGPTKWPLPPGGIDPMMQLLERDVLRRSPIVSDDDAKVYAYASEVMNEILAIHPFREGNGRTAFIVGGLILMQNDLLPLDVYDRKSDEPRYFAACEAGRIHQNYAPLAALIEEWEAAAIARWEATHAGK